MIGFKNVWLNIFSMAVLILSTILLYRILDKEKLTLTLGVTITLSIFGLILAWINREKDSVKKSIEEKASKPELEMVKKQLSEHIIDNHESYNALFTLLSNFDNKQETRFQKVEKKFDDFLMKLAEQTMTKKKY